MTALTAPRSTPAREPSDRVFGVAANTKILQGALVMLDGGYAKKGAAATGKVCVGMATETADNTGGSAGDVKINVRRGCFRFANSGTDAIDAADIGADCFIEDDQTVAATIGDPAAKSKAGQIYDVDAAGVWVLVG